MKTNSMPLKYDCLAYYYIGTTKFAFTFKLVKTKAGLQSFYLKSNKEFNLPYQLKVEYKDIKTGITKQY